MSVLDDWALDSRDGLDLVEIPLTLDHCHALGVYNNNDSGQRRTLNEAGERVCAVDRSFQSFEAHGGRGQDSFLRVVRQPPLTLPLARPFDGAPQRAAAVGGVALPIGCLPPRPAAAVAR